MAEQETNVPVKKVSPAPRPYSEMFDFHPLESLRRQINSLFPDLAGHKNLSDFEPFERFFSGWPAIPAVDLVEKDGEFAITAELPGLDEKNVEGSSRMERSPFQAKRRTSGRIRKRITTSRSAATARSNAPSVCRREWTRTRSKRPSTRAC